MEMHSLDFEESREKKIQQQNVTPVGIERRTSDFNSLHTNSLICWKSQDL